MRNCLDEGNPKSDIAPVRNSRYATRMVTWFVATLQFSFPGVPNEFVTFAFDFHTAIPQNGR